MFTVYILKLYNGKHYTGLTGNLQQRLAAHGARQSISTRKHLPYIFLHQESFNTRQEARLKEKSIKGQGAERYLNRLKYS